MSRSSHQQSPDTGDDPGAESPPRGAAAYDVLSEVRPLYQASGRAVEQSLQGTDLTTPLRAVLEVLLMRGPMTVPQVANEFGVTRQSVQALVDTGLARALLELADNPQHRRSRFVVVTDHGRRAFADVHRRELADLERVTADLEADGLDDDDLALCARVLAALTTRMRRLHDQHPDHTQPQEPS